MVKANKLTEKAFMAQVVKLATLCGWRVYHTHDSRRCVPGFPDLVLVHPGRGRVMWVELKVRKNALTPEQSAWLKDLSRCGEETWVWYPENWQSIERLLTGRDS